ncbi:MAG: S41 family peptidase [Gemmatimonadaceae bacterium]
MPTVTFSRRARQRSSLAGTSLLRGLLCALHCAFLSAILSAILSAFLGATALPLPAQSTGAAPKEQGVARETRERAHKILDQVRKDLKQHYYDSTFHGIDMDARFALADSALNTAGNNNQLFGIIAQYMADLNDSHTHFQPPDKVANVDYGFGLQIIGDSCFVIAVKGGSDAEKKGLAVGDVVLKLDAFKPERKTFRTLTYVYFVLSPRPGLRLTVQSPGGAPRQLDVMAKITMGERVVDYSNLSTFSRYISELEDASRRPEHFYRTFGDSVIIWRMPSFIATEEGVTEMMKLVRKHRALVLDLRNNGGGYVATELHLVGHFFDRDVQIGTVRQRAGTKPMVAPAISKEPYRGMFVILVNSNSASASEITARIMQLEARAVIVGDRTMGAVVTSIGLGHDVGFGKVLTYGVSVSVADVIMADGNRLEGVGVMPDHLVRPTGADLAARRDPAMAKALELAGVAMTPEQAGMLFRPKPK